MARYSETDILREVGRRAFEAARSYVREDRVLAFEPDDEIVSGQVLGTARRPYEQTITVEAVRGGVSIAGACTCPIGFNCKHVAAVLLFGLQASKPLAPSTVEERAARLLSAPAPRSIASPPQGATPLPGLAAWLDDLDRAQAMAEEEYPASIAQRLVYVLTPMPLGHGVPRLGFQAISARLLKNGSFSGSNRRYEMSAALSGTPAKFLRPSDLRILRAAMLLRRTHGIGTTDSLVEDGGAVILADILSTGRARWLAVDGPVLASGPSRAGRIVWQPAGEATLAAWLELDGEGIVLRATPPVYVDPERGLIGPVETPYPPRIAATLLAAPKVPAEAVADFNVALVRRAPGLAALAAPEPTRERMLGVPPIPVLRLFAADLPPESASPYGYYGYGTPPAPERVGLGRVSFRYGSVIIPLGEAKPVVTRLTAGQLIELHRDTDAERHAVAVLLADGFAPLPERRARVPAAHARDFVPEGDDLAWLDAQFHILPRLRAEGWEIEVSDDFPGRLLRAGGSFEAHVREGSGIDWLELDLGIMIDGERIDLIGPIVTMIAARGFDPAIIEATEDDEAAYLPLDDGRVLAFPAGRLDPIVAAIRDLALGNWAGEGRLRLSRADAAGLAAFEAAMPDTIWCGGERVREMGRRLGAAGGIPPAALPPGFRATLRPYQQEGVSWLAFLREVGFGGVLADDMGLGKTVQALALLAVEKAQGRLDGPALVVAPTSLMANWRREAERFAPDLRVLTLHGHDRADRFGAIPESDLVLTTYPLIARDHAVLAARTWPLLLLDEAQTIKNPDAATTKLLLGIAARHRVCMTGTPLENNLDELWSLFAFACPGLLGDRKSFARVWRNPIEKQGDRERGQQLARRVKPFLLRRTKAEVARELPPKTEIIERIDLQGPQRDVYEAIRLSMHARVSAAIAERGWARSRIVILDALLKLRQACCDPRLLKQPVADSDDKARLTRRNKARKPAVKPIDAGSAKLDRLEEMLVELLAEGRRILVFSQFTSMLSLIQGRLAARSVAYALLTGDTRDREAAIRQFEDGAVGVFLVSLKAGGTGLNLIAADTVILYDPWWNPAVEDQAVDRAYRIGQTKPVFVHKLVASGTIEEKMEVLKERKSALAQSLFDHEGAPTLAMTQADLEILLST